MAGTGDEGCGPHARAWAEACSSTAGPHVDAFRCPAGHLVASVAEPGGPVFVDVTAGSKGMRPVQGVSVSPVGEFTDFRLAPQPVKDGYARVVACVQRDAAVPLGEGGVFEAPPSGVQGASGPWFLLAGVCLAVMALAPRRLPRLAAWRDVALFLPIGGVVLALARAIAGESFFHQNGHGPNWIGYALGQPCTYGPGFAELFGWAARLHPHAPEALVFACNAALAATWPVATWIVARRVGAPRVLAWAFAGAVAADPLLWRIAFTESYYVPCTAMVLAGTAVSLSAPTSRPWSARFVLAQVAAGLLVAQAVRVHPVVWVAAGVVPLAQLAVPGSWKRSVKHAALATAALGGTVAVASGRVVLEVLRGAMGHQYVPEVQHGWHDQWQVVKAAVAGAVLLAAVTRKLRTRRLPRVVYGAIVVIAAAAGGSLFQIDVDWVKAAHLRMFVAALVATVVSLAVPWMRTAAVRWACVAGVVMLSLVNTTLHLRWATELPTDALELRRAMSWRDRIPEGARLVAVETAGIMAVQLPIYTAHRDERSKVVRLDAQGEPPSLASFGTDLYYDRSSLCSTASLRAWCDALEKGAALVPVDVADLPARPSTHAVDYDTEPVKVGLYRVVIPSRADGAP